MEVEEAETSNSLQTKKKKHKPGIVYLNYIPRYMTVKKVREHFSEFGEVKRMFLKPEKPQKPGKPSKFFSEGWVEFAKSKVAKRVAECLNGIQVGGKRHSPYYDALWSIKYLPKLQWSQLNEREVYKKAKMEQRMRAEIAKVKREVNFYTRGVEKMKHLKKGKKTTNQDEMKKQGRFTQVPQALEVNLSESKPSDARDKLLLRKVFGNSEND